MLIELKDTNKDTDYLPDRKYKNPEVIFIFNNIKMTLKSMGFSSKIK